MKKFRPRHKEYMCMVADGDFISYLRHIKNDATGEYYSVTFIQIHPWTFCYKLPFVQHVPLETVTW